MTTIDPTDRFIADWLEDGPVTAPPQARATVLGAFPSIAQRRPSPLRRAWAGLSPQLRVVLVAATILALLAAGLVGVPAAMRRLTDEAPPSQVPASVAPGLDTPAPASTSTVVPTGSPAATPTPVPLGRTPWILVRNHAGVGPAPAWLTVLAPDGSETRTVPIALETPGEPKVATWSPDGTEIAFAWGDATSAAVYRMPADGGAVQLVRDCVAPCADVLGLDWSPDGRTLAVAVTRSTGGRVTGGAIDVTDVATGAITTILELAGEAVIDPEWSPDGTRLAYWRVTGRDGGTQAVGAGRTHVINADGSDDRPVTPPGRVMGTPDWSPDGSRLVVAENPFEWLPTYGGLYLVDPDGGPDAQPILLLDPGKGGATDPAFTQDGQTIVFAWNNDVDTTNEIRSVGVDGSGMRTLNRAAARSYQTEPQPRPSAAP